MVLPPSLTSDEYSLIFSHHFGIRFRPDGQGKAPTNDYLPILSTALQFAGAAIFAMLAFLLPWFLAVLSAACVFAMIFLRFATLLVFALAVIQGKYLKQFYLSSILYWGWWPAWQCFFTAGGAVGGALVGQHIWTSNLQPYLELKKLQRYKDINTEVVPGERIQDAGLVEFTQWVQMDRSKGGCFMGRGNTYCVAPIVNGGEVKYGLAGTPHTGSYDYFAVGINCCSCPNRDFQCGEWQNPMANGGIRSLDEKNRPFFKLALEDWMASYGKTARNPMFFEWVQSPEWVWKGMWNYSLQLGWLAAAFFVSVGLTVGFLLDKMLQVLWLKDVVVPRSCLAPAPGLGRVTEILLPKMFYRYQEEQMQIAAMPVSAEWKPQRGPGSAGQSLEEQNQPGYGYGAMAGGQGSSMFGASGRLGAETLSMY